MIIIKKKKNDSIDIMLKKYKNKVKRTKQLDKLKEKQQYKKRSVTKREQKNKAIYVEKKYNNEA